MHNLGSARKRCSGFVRARLRKTATRNVRGQVPSHSGRIAQLVERHLDTVARLLTTGHTVAAQPASSPDPGPFDVHLRSSRCPLLARRMFGFCSDFTTPKPEGAAVSSTRGET